MQKHIIFIGTYGVGKSTLAKHVASRLDLEFYDEDHRSESLLELLQKPTGIIATNGASPMTHGETLQSHTLINLFGEPKLIQLWREERGDTHTIDSIYEHQKTYESLTEHHICVTPWNEAAILEAILKIIQKHAN
jgi:dephospho-CoA kinase